MSALNHALHHSESVQDGNDPKKPPELGKTYKDVAPGTKWKKVNGRWAIGTKKNIYEWDSKKGEVEWYKPIRKKAFRRL